MPTTVSNIADRFRAESIAQHQIRSRLAPLLTIVEQMESLYDRAIGAIADHPKPGAAMKVGLILTTRLANDLRVCSLTSQFGYGLQALVLAGTVLELVGSLSYVGDSDARSLAWANHSDHKHSYPPKVGDGIEATLKALGISDPAVSENWKQAYTFMCMAKHANPFLSLLQGLGIDSSGAYHVCGPDTSDVGMMLSARALWYAIGFGTFGVHVALGHSSDNVLQTQLRTEARSINDSFRGLEPWYLEVIKPQPSPTLRSEREASALSSEAQRLESETDRLRRETERIKQETSRLQQETGKVRRAHSGRRPPSA